MIEAEAADHAAPFVDVAGNLSARPRTLAWVPWSPPEWPVVGAAGPEQQSPDLAAILQEIVDRPGWVAGGSVAILVTGTGERVAESFDGVSSAAPLLHVEIAP